MDIRFYQQNVAWPGGGGGQVSLKKNLKKQKAPKNAKILVVTWVKTNFVTALLPPPPPIYKYI